MQQNIFQVERGPGINFERCGWGLRTCCCQALMAVLFLSWVWGLGSYRWVQQERGMLGGQPGGGGRTDEVAGNETTLHITCVRAVLL